jgi:hypothetical protein
MHENAENARRRRYTQIFTGDTTPHIWSLCNSEANYLQSHGMNTKTRNVQRFLGKMGIAQERTVQSELLEKKKLFI